MAHLLRNRANFVHNLWTPSNRTMFLHWGALPGCAGGLAGGLDGLSSLKISAILPKNPFFFFPSASTAFASCAVPPEAVGGGSALSPPKPSMREKNPFTPVG